MQIIFGRIQNIQNYRLKNILEKEKCRNIFVGCSVDDNIFKRNVISKEKHQQILKKNRY